MAIESAPSRETHTIRIAAAGDIHCREGKEAEVHAAFSALNGQADLILLAGDLTTCGNPEEAEVLAQACRAVDVPILAVLGNHDWHSGNQDRIVAILAEAGVEMLDKQASVVVIDGYEVGVVGGKGFVGGFAGGHLPDFGEPSLRGIYAETTQEVDAVDRGLREVANCPLRIVLLHYAPTEMTLEGERREIWPFLGTDRLALPIIEHEPDLVLHGHAHAGRLEGLIGEVPVYNVSVPVIGRDFWMLELSLDARATAPIH